MTEARRIIEALRCGIPNAHAVESLGSRQPVVENEFDRLLSSSQALPAGLLIKGGFGTGKSHTLEFLYQRALQQNFVCSKITINKETPLHDPHKLFRAAAESASVLGRCGNGIREAARSVDFKSEHYRDLLDWARDPSLDSRFLASLVIFESPKTDAETRDRMMQFWSGDPLGASHARDCLRRLRPDITGKFHTTLQRALVLHKFQFISRLMLAAGHRGWVILVDEVELIGCYSALQRAKSYVELARFTGQVPAFTCPHMIVVLAITDDFDAAVLEGKADVAGIPAMLNDNLRWAEIAPMARLGMQTIRSGATSLITPDIAEIRSLYAVLKALHGKAYSWDPPEVKWPERLITTRMRHYVKSWITEWDMRRMYPDEEIVVEQIEVKTDYTETIEELSEAVDEVERKSAIDEILERLR
jgi:P-loop Domain of unknown function (DUF2791)